MVKRALAQTARAYGIETTLEPTFYVYPDTMIRKRPDITFWSHTPITTDVTIVSPTDVLGDAAAIAAKEKKDEHTVAVSRLDHLFIPFAMETYGHFDKHCFDLFNKLASHLENQLRHDFALDMRHAASSALAKARAVAVRNACYAAMSFVHAA